MMRNWNVLKLTSLMAVAMAVAPLPAANPPAGPTEYGMGDIKELKDAIEALNKKLGEMVKSTNDGFAGLKIDMDRIKEDLKATYETKLKLDLAEGKIAQLEAKLKNLTEQDGFKGREVVSKYPGEKNALEECKARLEKIEAALQRLVEARTSFSPPAGMGRIALVNQYPEEILFTINGQPHRVPPFTTKNIENFPAGSFKYEVISPTYGLRGTNTPMLEPGKTYSITVR